MGHSAPQESPPWDLLSRFMNKPKSLSWSPDCSFTICLAHFSRDVKHHSFTATVTKNAPNLQFTHLTSSSLFLNNKSNRACLLVNLIVSIEKLLSIYYLLPQLSWDLKLHDQGCQQPWHIQPVLPYLWVARATQHLPIDSLSSICIKIIHNTLQKSPMLFPSYPVILSPCVEMAAGPRENRSLGGFFSAVHPLPLLNQAVCGRCPTRHPFQLLLWSQLSNS